MLICAKASAKLIESIGYFHAHGSSAQTMSTCSDYTCVTPGNGCAMPSINHTCTEAIKRLATGCNLITKHTFPCGRAQQVTRSSPVAKCTTKMLSSSAGESDVRYLEGHSVHTTVQFEQMLDKHRKFKRRNALSLRSKGSIYLSKPFEFNFAASNC